MKTIAITAGDPAGIGPEIISKCLAGYPLRKDVAYVIYGNDFLPPGFSFICSEKELTGNHRDSKKIMIIKSPRQIVEGCRLYAVLISTKGVTFGKPNRASGKASFECLQRAVSDIKEFQFEALVTLPVSKKSIREFDPSFIGHTEFLAREFNSDTFVMNFVSDTIDVALLTTHTALRNVWAQITEERIIPKMRMVREFVRQRYTDARVALLGLNPHCGEDGAFGKEEEILRNALRKLAGEGVKIDGPFPADSFFKYNLTTYRQVIACYHDQGLIPFKMIARDEGVNVTLGLPFFRASVDHGTAYDIAGKRIASPRSLISALNLTGKIIEAL